MKQMVKRIGVMVLAFALLISSNAYALSKVFPDARGHWAEQAILRLTEKGVIAGYPDGSVKPDNIITRGEFCALLARNLSLDLTKAEKEPPAFSDIGRHWSKKNIGALVDSGILDPADYTAYFKPDEPITRIEIIRMLVRVIGEGDKVKQVTGNTGFQDDAAVADKDKGYVIIAKEKNLINGYPDNTIRPNGKTTRAEAFTLLDNQNRAKDKQDDGTKTPTNEGSGSSSGGGSHSYPQAQVSFELPTAAHTDTEISIATVVSYAKALTWSLSKEAADGAQTAVDISTVIQGSLTTGGGTIVIKESGTYTLTATAVNYGGRETAFSKSITVYPVLDAGFDLPEYTHTDRTVTVTTAAVSGSYDLAWSVAGSTATWDSVIDGTLFNDGGTIAFKEKGRYTLTASVTDVTGRTFTHREDIEVYPVVHISFELPATTHTDTTIKLAATLTETDGLGVEWSLARNGGQVSLADYVEGSLTGSGGNIRFKDKGVYALTARVTDKTGRSFETTAAVTVYPVGTAGFYLPEITHTDKPVKVEATFLNIDTATAVWKLTRNGAPVALNEYVEGTLTNEGGAVRFKVKGTYVLEASFTDGAGRTYSYSSPVLVYPVPALAFQMPAAAHTDSDIKVTATSTDMEGLTVEWLVDNTYGFQDWDTYIDGRLNNAGGTIRFKHAGVYTLVARTTDATGRVFLYEPGDKIEVHPVLDIRFDLPETTYPDRTIDLRTHGNIGVLPVEWSVSKDGNTVPIDACVEGSLNAQGGKIRFTGAGQYTLTASMTDALGRVFSYSDNITVYPIPEIQLTLPQTAYAGEAATAAVTGSRLENLTAAWTLSKSGGDNEPYTDYADGSLTNAGGSIAFKVKGDYVLTVTMTDTLGRAFAQSKAITVYPIPGINLALPQTAYVGEAATAAVSGNDLENLTAVWTLSSNGGGNKPYTEYAAGNLTNEGGSVTFQSKGSYILTVTMTDVLGRDFSQSKTITVYPIPEISLVFPQTAYAGEAAAVAVNGSNLENLTAAWTLSANGGDNKPYADYVTGSLTNAGGSITFKDKGSYILTVTMTDALGRTFSQCKTITVYPIPEINLVLPQTAYTGEAATVAVNGSNLENLTAIWTLSANGGPNKPYTDYAAGTLSKEGGSITFNTKGSCVLTITMTDTLDRTFSQSKTITVYPIPGINLALPQTAYVGEAAAVTVTGSNLDNLTAAWTISANSRANKPYTEYATGSLSNAGGNITFKAKGSYILTVTLTDALGRTFSQSKAVTVYPIPDMQIGLPQLTYSGDILPVTVSGTELSGLNISWRISIDGGTALPYTQYATGSLGNNGGEVRISTDKTITVKFTAIATDANGRSFTFISGPAAVKPIVQCAFTAPASIHVGTGFTVTMGNVSGLEGKNIVWSLAQGGNSATCTGTLTNAGGNISIGPTGAYTLTASVTNDAGRIFTHSENINVTNTAPNKPTVSATVTRTAKDGKLLVNFAVSATDPDGDAVTCEYSGQSADGYYAVGSYAVKVRAKDAFGLYSDWTTISFTVTNSEPTTPVITRTPNGNSVAPGTAVTITASSTDADGDAITYVWEGRPAESSTYPLGKNTVRVKAVDATGAESPWTAIVFFVADANSGGGMTLTGPESVILEQGIAGATITQYTFTVPPVDGHSGSDYGRVRGYNVNTGVWDQLDYQTTTNGITFSRTLAPGIYSQLEFYYYTNHNCMYNKSNITYSVTYYFE